MHDEFLEFGFKNFTNAVRGVCKPEENRNGLLQVPIVDCTPLKGEQKKELIELLYIV
jgi:hypothetical protein